MSEKIFVQIASYLDLELYPTVEDLLKKARYPENIFLSIYSQDDNHPNLEEIFAQYPDTKYKYVKVAYEKAKGVGYARAQANKFLTDEYEFFLQIDSHSRFDDDWDKRIIEDYKTAHDHWGKMVFSCYVPTYNFETNEVAKHLTALKITKPEKYGIPFSREYTDYVSNEYGQETGFMSGHFLFGYTKYILEVPYDPSIYFEGEEHSMSVRFFDQGTKIIAPASTYVFHDYDGRNRKRHWDADEQSNTYDYLAVVRVRHFFAGKITDQYGVSKKSINNFLEKFLFTD
jgi:hypothetical protein